MLPFNLLLQFTLCKLALKDSKLNNIIIVKLYKAYHKDEVGYTSMQK